jgi:hypothetical protein
MDENTDFKHRLYTIKFTFYNEGQAARLEYGKCPKLQRGLKYNTVTIKFLAANATLGTQTFQ